MTKLVAVEYAPTDPGTGKRPPANPLAGLTGETFDRILKGAINTAKKGLMTLKQGVVPVRFPLAAPNGRVILDRGQNDPLDLEVLKSEAIMLPVTELFRADRTPLSLYERRIARNIADLDELTDSSHYLVLPGKDSALRFLYEASKKYSRMYVWKRETVDNPNEPPPVVIEARLYGLDNLLPVYDARAISGAAFEIISRPWPTAQERKAGIVAARFRSDVYLLSKGEDYIRYLDGVELQREATNGEALFQYYSPFMAAAQAREARHNLDKYKRLPKPAANAIEWGAVPGAVDLGSWNNTTASTTIGTTTLTWTTSSTSG